MVDDDLIEIRRDLARIRIAFTIFIWIVILGGCSLGLYWKNYLLILCLIGAGIGWGIASSTVQSKRNEK